MKKLKQVSIYKVFYQLSTISLVVSLGFFLYYHTYHMELNLSVAPCMPLSLLHIYCPGCGGTRALKAMLDLKFIQAFLCNPFIIYCFIMFLYYYIGTSISILTKGKIRIFKFSFWIIYLGIGIFIVNCILRNVLAIAYGFDYLGDIWMYWN